MSGKKKHGGHHHHEHTHLHCCGGAHCGHCDCCKDDSHEDEKHTPKVNWQDFFLVVWSWIIFMARKIIEWAVPALIAVYLYAAYIHVEIPYRALTTDETLYDRRVATVSACVEGSWAAYFSGCTPASANASSDDESDGSGNGSGNGGGIDAGVSVGSIPELKLQLPDFNSRNSSSGGQAGSPEDSNGPPPILSPENFERHVDLAIQEADGSRIAGELRRYWLPPLQLLPSSNERGKIRELFVKKSQAQGERGFYRLGLTFLGSLAFDLAKADSKIGKNEFTERQRLFIPYSPNSDFVPKLDEEEGYINFALAQECRTSGTLIYKRWMNAIEKHTNWSEGAVNKLQREAYERYLEGTEKVGRIKFCTGFDDTPANECLVSTKSRQALKLGDAKWALGKRHEARECWQIAIDLAKETETGAPVDPDGAPAAMTAQKRLQNGETTCKWTSDSLAAISRDYKARSGDLIHIKVLQQALRALGHYDGQLDGDLSPQTRAAIRKFQRERQEDETDTLTPEQIVNLICNAAEGAGDVVAQTKLGIMYATGLGVVQNIDQSRYWLTLASTQHQYPDATYNLAVLFGTGIILDSYQLCDVPRVPEQADKYLQEAAGQGHPIAIALMRQYGPGSPYATLRPRERWALIELQQFENSTADKTGLYAHRLAPIGTKCPPDRSIRGEAK